MKNTNRRFRKPPIPGGPSHNQTLRAKLERAAVIEGHMVGMYHQVILRERRKPNARPEYERGVRDAHKMTYRRITNESPWLRPLVADAIRFSRREERRMEARVRQIMHSRDPMKPISTT